jgi:hypothetical protein
MAIRIGLLDSGVNVELGERMLCSCAFQATEQGGIVAQQACADAIDHGSAIARILLAAAPDAQIVNAQVFHQAGVTAPDVVAAGLDWLLTQQVDIVNMSFGLRHNRAVLREACERALAAGVILLASAPARGPAVFPATYPGVLRITGDARCGLHEFSHLASRQADFGACVRAYTHPQTGSAVGGASFAVPHVAAALAEYLELGGDPAQAAAYLRRIARYHGPERRGA